MMQHYFSDHNLSYALPSPSRLFSECAEDFMTKFMSNVVSTCLNNALSKMMVLRGMFRLHGNFPLPKVIIYKPLKDRFEKHDSEDIKLISALNYSKLQKEVNYLLIILNEAVQEIKEFGTYLNVVEMTHVLEKMIKDEIDLVEDETANKKAINVLKAQYIQEKKYYTNAIEETVKQIHVLKFKLEDESAYCKTELEYVKNFENSRIAQNDITLGNKEQSFQAIIDEMTQKTDMENRVHTEMTNFLEESKDYYSEETNRWMKQYDKELEKLDKDILELKSNFEKLTEEYAASNAIHTSRAEVITAWQEYKRVKREREHRERLELWASTTLQIWWRYMMRKHKLGPFRKKRGKGKKK